MRLKDIGEFGFIDLLKKRVRTNPSVVVGIGDDAAVMRLDAKNDLLFTTDMLIEGRHFRRKEASPFEIGWKAMAVNLSDIAAMGGVPAHAVIAAGLPSDLEMKFLKALYAGIAAAARKFRVNLVGGDTSASDKIVLSVAMIGRCPAGKAFTRGGARPGDVLLVTGPLGGSYRSRKHLRFTPRIREALFLRKHFSVHAMMDLSDGLSSDLRRLTGESRAGARLFAEKIPLARGSDLAAALGDGEDFELLFTLSKKDAARLPRRRAGMRFIPVGEVVGKKNGVTLVRGGIAQPLADKGYDHFR